MVYWTTSVTSACYCRVPLVLEGDIESAAWKKCDKQVRVHAKLKVSASQQGTLSILLTSVFSLDNKNLLQIRVNPWKATTPDSKPGRVLRECADQLADVLPDIFNVPLSITAVPTCFKATAIIRVPKRSSVSCLNYYCPTRHTNHPERLVMRHIKSQLSLNWNPCSLRIIPATQQMMPYHDPSPGPHPPEWKWHLWENAVHRFQCSIQHHHSSAWTLTSATRSWTSWLGDHGQSESWATSPVLRGTAPVLRTPMTMLALIGAEPTTCL